MKLADVIRAEKTELRIGEWQQGRVPRSTFPMSKVREKYYKFGPEYKWRLVRFNSGDMKCRVLILLNEGKQIFRARLGVEKNGDMVVLCDHEFHASEPGWHCHCARESACGIEPGAARSHTQRWPASASGCSIRDFAVDGKTALTVAAERFNFRAQGKLL